METKLEKIDIIRHYKDGPYNLRLDFNNDYHINLAIPKDASPDDLEFMFHGLSADIRICIAEKKL